ncbi:MAG: glucose-6-phosphate dehydrogenase [Bacteroidales bacterium]|nr:glucose-6-phosphate dehydrogenase [Bacteroidales bacterium]
MKKPGHALFVIFGASGDLTYRKLIPALYALYVQDLMPEKFYVLGVSRTKIAHDEFIRKMSDGIKQFVQPGLINEGKKEDFLKYVSYFSMDMTIQDNFDKLKEQLTNIQGKYQLAPNYIFHLALPPQMFEVVSSNLAAVGLNQENNSYSRLIVEKPFGTNLQSAQKLNKNLHENFHESQIYRIDHYLGKETVQNILVTRFANGIFEPLWNRNYIQYVEITSSESLGVENRGRYYDQSGALRDMLQNHLMQLVGFTAMEPPASLEANAIRNEVLKVFQSIRPIQEDEVANYLVRGQYTSSNIRGEVHKGYREENGVPGISRTETFVAMKFFIDNWRWGGVPFYIRTGKGLPTRVTEIVVHFKATPHFLFSNPCEPGTCNQLIIRIQPDEGILLKFSMKQPGTGFNIKPVNLGFHYKDYFDVLAVDSYARLLYDALIGDSTLFARGDIVEEAWRFVAPVQKAWKNNDDIPVYGYPKGTWGPQTAAELFENKELTWRYPCKNLTDDGEYCEL